jgi:hypothetical protein
MCGHGLIVGRGAIENILIIIVIRTLVVRKECPKKFLLQIWSNFDDLEIQKTFSRKIIRKCPNHYSSDF